MKKSIVKNNIINIINYAIFFWKQVILYFCAYIYMDSKDINKFQEHLRIQVINIIFNFHKIYVLQIYYLFFNTINIVIYN
jgi:hypothetical protein